METLRDVFDMGLFPHLYAIPITIILGMAIGYYLRGKIEAGEEKLPPKPKVE